MPFNDFSFDASSQFDQMDEMRKRRAAQAAQATTNSQYNSQMGQQTAQPAGGHAGDQLPTPAGQLASQIMSGSKGAGAAPRGGVTGTRAQNPEQPWQYQPQASSPSYQPPSQPRSWPDGGGIDGGRSRGTGPAWGGAPAQQQQPPATTATPATTAITPRDQFDVDGYLTANPDVAAAIRGGAFGRDPYAHYVQYGAREGRTGHALPQQPAQAATPSSTSQTTTSATANAFGNAANLDPAFLASRVRAAFAAAGRTPTEQDIQYWVNKASTPDIYSDGQTRVGWNPYWEDRIRTGSDSSDPRLAGSEGIISNPGQYGYGTFTGTDGDLYFTREGQTRSAQGGLPFMPFTPSAGNGGGYAPQTYAAPSALPFTRVTPRSVNPVALPTYQAGQVDQYQAADTSAQLNAMRQLAGQQPRLTGPQYQAGQAPAFNPADISALLSQMQGMATAGTGVKVPQYQAGQVDQFAGGAGSEALGAALQQLLGAGALVDPNVSGQKESAKETLLAAQQAQRDAMLGSAASRNSLGSGALAALQAQSGDAFAGNLTDTYRTIDADAQQRGLANRLNVGSALTGLGQAQGSERRADYGTTLAGQQAQEQLRQMETTLGLQAGTLTSQLQNQQFGQLANVAGLTADNARANQATALQTAQQQAQMDQAAASLGMTRDQLAAQFQQQQFGQQGDIASLLQSIGQGNYASQLAGQQAQAQRDQAANASQQAAAQQAFQQALSGAGLDLQGQQMNAQLEQAAAQHAAQLGYNYAQLSQQDKQYFAQLAQQNQQFGQTFGLNSAIASQNANSDFMNTLLRMFG